MKNKWLLLLLMPGFLMVSIFLVLPVLYCVIPTFLSSEGISFKEYLDLFQDIFFLKVFFRTVKLALITALICIALGIPTAYYISRSKKSIRGVLIVCTTFPLLTNSVVRAFAWITILGRNGVVNKLLMSLHLVSEPLKLLYTEPAIVIGSVYLFLPIMISSLVGVMEHIDNDLILAAGSLGANKLKAFLTVVLPLCIPGLIVGSVMVFTGAASAYTTPQLLGGNKNMVMATFIYQQSMILGDWTAASVVATIMVVLSILVIAVFNRIAAMLNKRGV